MGITSHLFFVSENGLFSINLKKRLYKIWLLIYYYVELKTTKEIDKNFDRAKLKLYP